MNSAKDFVYKEEDFPVLSPGLRKLSHVKNDVRGKFDKEKKRDSQSLQESAMEFSPSSSSGSPALTSAVEDSEEKSDSVQEVDTEVSSFCLYSLSLHFYPAD